MPGYFCGSYRAIGAQIPKKLLRRNYRELDLNQNFVELRTVTRKSSLAPLRGLDLKSRATAFEKLQTYLAIRDHSILELRQKLQRLYEEHEINEAIEKADKYKLLKEPIELSEQVIRIFENKKQGFEKIAFELEKRGLPLPTKNEESELYKAQDLILKKMGKSSPFSYEEKSKIFRLLKNRGFDVTTIQKALSEPTMDEL